MGYIACMLVVRTPHSLGRYRVLFTGAIALNLLHCGDTDENLQDDLQASDASGGDDNPATGDAGLNISGDWGFFLFEDPVAVNLQQAGDELSGYGCCIPDQAAENYCCGPIEGSIDDQRVSFSFPLGDTGDRYRAEVVVSDDGTRMGGSFFRDHEGDSTPASSLKGAWLRYDSFERNWLTTYPELGNELSSLEGLSSLRLSADSETGDGYDHDTEYRLVSSLGSLGGALGPFWGSEISVREADGAIVAGPVPATDPSLPARLVLRRSGSTLLDAEVTMGSGATYHFEVP
jgi:hypothetical protein